MPPASASSSSGLLQHEALRFYRALTETVAPSFLSDRDAAPHLGGLLLYAGELDLRGSALVIAGNVAGCASLATSADPTVQKQVIRDGTVDFVVTSLDEALRILKNEIRKKAAVAVCVGLSSSAVEAEMQERGVLPDVVAGGSPGDQSGIPKFGSDCREVRLDEPYLDKAMIEWQAESSARWMAKVDAIAIECLSSDHWAQRWLRLSPRYSGRSMQGQRLVCCEPEAAENIVQELNAAVRDGKIGTEISGSVTYSGETKVFRLWPPV